MYIHDDHIPFAGQEEGTEVEGSEDEGDVSESDEDPDRLWCICRQPHNDRYIHP